MKRSKKYTIGLLVSGIMDGFTVPVCQGIIDAAKAIGINLIIFPGKYLDRDFTNLIDNFYDYQYNLVFSYAKKESLDALLVSANTIGCFTTPEKMQEMLSQYTGIPCVLLASHIDGYTDVNFDNSSGIKEAIHYLVHSLNCTKIGMIGGPDNNSDALARKQAFAQALEMNGLSFPDHRYIQGDLSRHSLNVFRTFLDNNPDLEAVFCVNDDTAIGLYDVLTERNMTAGKDLLVVGYDNIPYVANMSPPLSSIWADSTQLGKTAVQMVYQILQGKQVESQVITTRFIKRESLGIKEFEHNIYANNSFDANYINAIFKDIFYRYNSSQNEAEYNRIFSSFRLLMESIFSAYKCTKPDPEIINQALYYCDLLLSNNVLDHIDIERFMKHIENINAATAYTHTEVYSAIYQRIILSMKQQYGQMIASYEYQKYSIVHFVKDNMLFEDGSDESYTVLLQHLDWLQIRNASLYAFEKPIVHPPKHNLVLPDKLYIKAVLQNGKVQSIPSSKQEISSTEVYTNPYVNRDLPQILFPLYSKETIYGLLLCDMSGNLYNHGDFLVNQISSSMKVIQLLKNNDLIQQQLENSLEILSKNNITLDHLSKYDALTEILNRRGLLDAAEKLLAQNIRNHIDTLVVYIDMNNLKLVNDQYGHDEGDYSIKKIAEILKGIIGENGIVGRLGGDEFALIMDYKKDFDIASDIYSHFDAFNQTSSKPYIINVSAGTYTVYADNPITLSSALSEADKMLYIAKQHRKKNISK